MRYKSRRTIFATLQLLIYLSVTEGIAFYRANLCDVKTRLSNKWMTQVSRDESSLNCCVRCSSDSTCLGASLQLNTSTCYLHSQCNATSNCSKGDTGFKHYLKRPDKLTCVYGTWNETTGTCKCSYPRVGPLCRLPANCTEFSQNWPTTYGDSLIPVIPPPITTNIIVICSRTKTTLSTMVLRNVGELNFNRTWKEYADGFFTPPPPYNLSFWSGMEALRSLLGSKPRAIKINIVFNSGTTKRYDHSYAGVVIGNSSTNYLLTYNSHKSSSYAGFCLELSNNTSFSTWDADHDNNSTENWASKAGAGWWFPASNFTCNPLGSFYSNKSTPASDDACVRFTGFSADRIKNLVQVEMVIEETYA